MVAAVFLMSYKLGNLPGVNADESISAYTGGLLMRGYHPSLVEPNGAPFNLFLVVPIGLALRMHEPTVALMRSFAVAFMLMGLVANFVCIRKFCGLPMACLSTAILAAAPFNMLVLGRLFWPPSQCLIVEVLAINLSLIILYCRRCRKRIVMHAILVAAAAGYI